MNCLDFRRQLNIDPHGMAADDNAVMILAIGEERYSVVIDPSLKGRRIKGDVNERELRVSEDASIAMLRDTIAEIKQRETTTI